MKSISTAVNDNGIFNHLNIHPVTAFLYSRDESEILIVELEAAADQNIQSNASQTKNTKPDYWAWWDAAKKKFTNMYPQRFLLNLIFPYGIEAAEEHGDGKAYRVSIKVIDGNQKNK